MAESTEKKISEMGEQDDVHSSKWRDAIHKISDIFSNYNNKISDTVQTTLEEAQRGNAQAMKDLFFFINNRRTGIPKDSPESKELWNAGHDLLQESAARGNKQAISDLAYVKYHGINGTKVDRAQAFELMQKIGCKSKADVFRKWDSKYKAKPEEEKLFASTEKNTKQGLTDKAEKKIAITEGHNTKKDPLAPESQSEIRNAVRVEEGRLDSRFGIVSVTKEDVIASFDANKCFKVELPNGVVKIDCSTYDSLRKLGVEHPERLSRREAHGYHIFSSKDKEQSVPENGSLLAEKERSEAAIKSEPLSTPLMMRH